jgi:hypothetical protein
MMRDRKKFEKLIAKRIFSSTDKDESIFCGASLWVPPAIRAHGSFIPVVIVMQDRAVKTQNSTGIKENISAYMMQRSKWNQRIYKKWMLIKMYYTNKHNSDEIAEEM